MGLERGAGVTVAMRRCACYALFFGLCAGTLVYFLAEPVGFLWIGDARTVRSLRITSISLPCIALSAVMGAVLTMSLRCVCTRATSRRSLYHSMARERKRCRPAFAGRHLVHLQVCRSVLIFVVEISGVRGR